MPSLRPRAPRAPQQIQRSRPQPITAFGQSRLPAAPGARRAPVGRPMAQLGQMGRGGQMRGLAGAGGGLGLGGSGGMVGGLGAQGPSYRPVTPGQGQIRTAAPVQQARGAFVPIFDIFDDALSTDAAEQQHVADAQEGFAGMNSIEERLADVVAESIGSTIPADVGGSLTELGSNWNQNEQGLGGMQWANERPTAMRPSWASDPRNAGPTGRTWMPGRDPNYREQQRFPGSPVGTTVSNPMGSPTAYGGMLTAGEEPSLGGALGGLGLDANGTPGGGSGPSELGRMFDTYREDTMRTGQQATDRASVGAIDAMRRMGGFGGYGSQLADIQRQGADMTQQNLNQLSRDQFGMQLQADNLQLMRDQFEQSIKAWEDASKLQWNQLNDEQKRYWTQYEDRFADAEWFARLNYDWAQAAAQGDLERQKELENYSMGLQKQFVAWADQFGPTFAEQMIALIAGEGVGGLFGALGSMGAAAIAKK